MNNTESLREKPECKEPMEGFLSGFEVVDSWSTDEELKNHFGKEKSRPTSDTSKPPMHRKPTEGEIEKFIETLKFVHNYSCDKPDETKAQSGDKIKTRTRQECERSKVKDWSASYKYNNRKFSQNSIQGSLNNEHIEFQSVNKRSSLENSSVNNNYLSEGRSIKCKSVGSNFRDTKPNVSYSGGTIKKTICVSSSPLRELQNSGSPMKDGNPNLSTEDFTVVDETEPCPADRVVIISEELEDSFMNIGRGEDFNVRNRPRRFVEEHNEEDLRTVLHSRKERIEGNKMIAENDNDDRRRRSITLKRRDTRRSRSSSKKSTNRRSRSRSQGHKRSALERVEPREDRRYSTTRRKKSRSPSPDYRFRRRNRSRSSSRDQSNSSYRESFFEEIMNKLETKAKVEFKTSYMPGASLCQAQVPYSGFIPTHEFVPNPFPYQNYYCEPYFTSMGPCNVGQPQVHFDTHWGPHPNNHRGFVQESFPVYSGQVPVDARDYSREVQSIAERSEVPQKERKQTDGPSEKRTSVQKSRGKDSSGIPPPPPPPVLTNCMESELEKVKRGKLHNRGKRKSSGQGKEENLSKLLQDKNLSLSCLLEAAISPGKKKKPRILQFKKEIVSRCEAKITQLYRRRIAGVGCFMPNLTLDNDISYKSPLELWNSSNIRTNNSLESKCWRYLPKDATFDSQPSIDFRNLPRVTSFPESPLVKKTDDKKPNWSQSPHFVDTQSTNFEATYFSERQPNLENQMQNPPPFSNAYYPNTVPEEKQHFFPDNVSGNTDSLPYQYLNNTDNKKQQYISSVYSNSHSKHYTRYVNEGEKRSTFGSNSEKIEVTNNNIVPLASECNRIEFFNVNSFTKSRKTSDLINLTHASDSDCGNVTCGVNENDSVTFLPKEIMCYPESLTKQNNSCVEKVPKRVLNTILQLKRHVVDSQNKDPDIFEQKTVIEQGNLPDDYEIIEGILYNKFESDYAVTIPHKIYKAIKNSINELSKLKINYDRMQTLLKEYFSPIDCVVEKLVQVVRKSSLDIEDWEQWIEGKTLAPFKYFGQWDEVQAIDECTRIAVPKNAKIQERQRTTKNEITRNPEVLISLTDKLVKVKDDKEDLQEKVITRLTQADNRNSTVQVAVKDSNSCKYEKSGGKRQTGTESCRPSNKSKRTVGKEFAPIVVNLKNKERKCTDLGDNKKVSNELGSKHRRTSKSGLLKNDTASADRVIVKTKNIEPNRTESPLQTCITGELNSKKSKQELGNSESVSSDKEKVSTCGVVNKVERKNQDMAEDKELVAGVINGRKELFHGDQLHQSSQKLTETTTSNNEKTQAGQFSKLLRDTVLEAQLLDESTNSLIQAISNGNLDTNKEYILRGGVLCKKYTNNEGTEKLKMLLPCNAVDNIIVKVHTISVPHASYERTLLTLEKYFSPIENIEILISQCLQECLHCKKN